MTNLTWQTIGDPQTLITRDGSYLRIERVAIATVSGTATVNGALFTFSSGQLDIHQEFNIPNS